MESMASEVQRVAPPRALFTRIGLFNEKLERTQDMEFNLRLRRAGGKILLAPDIESCYYARATLKSFWRHNWVNGVWAVLPFAYAEGMPVRWRRRFSSDFSGAMHRWWDVGSFH